MASSAHASPTRPTHPQNAHPYSIKTTSTGILTRSNSSNAHGSWARHKYSPVPPSPRIDASPTRSEMSLSPSPSKYTRSWVGRSPAGTRVKLPRHPYLWTPAHLGTYLSTALNGSDGEPLDPEVVQHIVQFVQEQKIGGRAFLGLDQEDFQEMDGVDATWADAFWDAACTLRAAATPYRPSRISSGATKRGRVRGIVGVFERNASESSDLGEDESPRRSRLRGSSVSGAGYDSTGDEAESVPLTTEASETGGGSEQTSVAPTPRHSHTPAPRSPEADRDRTPHTREVEIVSVPDANSEPTMAELYERTYGVRAPSPTHRLASDGEEDIGPGETVKITAPEDTTADSPRGEVIALPSPAPPSLVELFVPASLPAAPIPAPERHVLVPSPAVVDRPATHNIFVLPSGGDADALRTLDTLKTRLELVENRIAEMERKDTANGVAQNAEFEDHDDTAALWNETRQSAYVLLAGATAGAAIVLVPLVLRHLFTR